MTLNDCERFVNCETFRGDSKRSKSGAVGDIVASAAASRSRQLEFVVKCDVVAGLVVRVAAGQVLDVVGEREDTDDDNGAADGLERLCERTTVNAHLDTDDEYRETARHQERQQIRRGRLVANHG